MTPHERRETRTRARQGALAVGVWVGHMNGLQYPHARLAAPIGPGDTEVLVNHGTDAEPQLARYPRSGLLQITPDARDLVRAGLGAVLAE